MSMNRFNLEPLRLAPYRRYLLATMLASLALWVYEPAVEWIVLRRTGSTAAVGFLQTVLIIPVALAALPSGLLADRLGPRRLLAVSLFGIAGAVAGVGVLGAFDNITFELAVLMTLILGIFDGLYGVPVQLLLNRMVEPRLLGSAIGLSMLTSGLGRLVGAPLGGFVLQAFGPAQAFLPAAAVLVISGIVFISIPVTDPREHGVTALAIGDLRDSLAWLRRERVALSVTALGAISAAFVLGYGALLPTVTRDLLHADAATLGLLSGAGGIGVILSSLTMEALGRRAGRGRLLVLALVISGAALGALGLAGILPIAMVLTAAVGLFSSTFGGTAALLLQTVAPPRMRGRAIALYSFVLFSVLPISTVSMGVLTDHLGVGAVLGGVGGLTILGTVLVTLAYRRLLGTDIGREGEVLMDGQPVIRPGSRSDRRTGPPNASATATVLPDATGDVATAAEASTAGD
jgi:MFS family permease